MRDHDTHGLEAPTYAADRFEGSTDRRLKSVPGWALDIGVGCLLVGAFLVFAAEPLPVDPMLYLEAAQDPLQSELNVGTARLGLLAPVWVASLLFGFSEASLYLIPLCFVFILGVATSALGRHVFGPLVGAMAAFVAASGPIILPYGTQLLPDIGAAALVTGSLLFVFRASESSDQNKHRDSLAAGLLFGCAYLVKETSLIFAPAILVAAWILRVRDRRMISLILGALVAPVIEVPAGWLLWGDPFFRFDAVVGRGAPLSDESQRGQTSFLAQETYFDALRTFINLLGTSIYGKLVLLGSGALGLVAAVTRRRRYLALTAWILITWAGFAAVGAIKQSGRILIRLLLERYWAFLMPGLAIAAVGSLALLLNWLTKARKTRKAARVLLVLAAATVVVLGGLASFDLRGDWFMRFGNDGFWQLRSSLSSMPQGVQLHVDGRFASLVRLYTNDTLGRPVTTIDVVRQSEHGRDSEWLLILPRNQGSRSSNREATTVPIPVSYGVHAAERARAEWVLLTTNNDHAVNAERLLTVGPSSVEWLGRTVRNGTWSDPFDLPEGAVVIPSDEQLIVFDGSAAYGQPNTSPQVDAGGLVELQVRLHSIDGRVRVVCHFHDVSAQGDRNDVSALTVFRGEGGSGRLTSFCRAPTDGGDQVVRPILVLDGPGSIQVGNALLLAHAD